MHEIHQLYSDLLIEFIHRDYAERALASCPEHFTLRKVSRNCNEYSCVQGQRETDRETERQRLREKKGRWEGGGEGDWSAAGQGTGILTWEKVKKALFHY